MSSKEEKRAKRLENKKRKIEAFLNVAKLNETDVVKKRKVECTSENFNLLVNSVDNGNVFHMIVNSCFIMVKHPNFKFENFATRN